MKPILKAKPMETWVWEHSGRINNSVGLFSAKGSKAVTKDLNSSPLVKQPFQRDYGRRNKQIWLYSRREQPELADIVLALMERTGWSRVALSTRMGVSVQTVSKIASGNQTGLTPTVKARLAHILEGYPDLYEHFSRLNIRGTGRPSGITRIT
jgi:hypothetical protein